MIKFILMLPSCYSLKQIFKDFNVVNFDMSHFDVFYII